MQYSDARRLITDGDIVFVRGSWNRPVQSLVMWATNSEYSHVGIAFWVTINNNQRLMIVEAQGGTKRRILNMSFYKNKKLDVISTPRPWKEYADSATDNLGIVSYGWFDAIYAGFREKFQNYIYLPQKNLDSGEICSEFVAKQLQLQDTNISPQGLFNALIKNNNTIKLKIF